MPGLYAARTGAEGALSIVVGGETQNAGETPAPQGLGVSQRLPR
jgi:hypothetical protein